VVRNVHERRVEGAVAQLSDMIDNVAGPNDTLWPADAWPPLQLDHGLTVGSTGGHGPIRYFVDGYTPTREITFRFADGMGIDGIHRLTIEELSDTEAVVRHELEGRLTGSMRVVWPLTVRWLHDALIEDLFDNAEAAVSSRPVPPARRHPLGVRLLRQAMAPAPHHSSTRHAAGVATAATLGIIGALHAAWAAGSSFPASDKTALARAVVGGTTFPDATSSAVVAVLLAVSTALVAARSDPQSTLGKAVPGQLAWAGTVTTAGVLGLRGVAGFVASTFHVIDTTREFRRLDLLAYSPLCIALALGALAVVRPSRG
jgi:Protein of unknown function (DUF3995)